MSHLSQGLPSGDSRPDRLVGVFGHGAGEHVVLLLFVEVLCYMGGRCFARLRLKLGDARTTAVIFLFKGLENGLKEI